MMARVTKTETALRAAFRHAPEAHIQAALRLMRGGDPILEADKLELTGTPFMRRHMYLNRSEMRMHLLDHLLETHGVEALDNADRVHSSPRWEYLNVGDPYVATVVWYRSSNRFYIRCYGDIVESYRLK